MTTELPIQTALNVSLFCNRHNWGSLFLSIEEYLNNKRKKNKFNKGFISLSDVDGDHIQLTVLVAEEDKEEEANYLDRYFMAVLEKYDISPAIEFCNVEKVFCDFPENSIQYGLHNKLFFDQLLGDKGRIVQFINSDFIIAVLKRAGSVTDTDIMTIALFMCLGLIEILKRGNLIANTRVLSDIKMNIKELSNSLDISFLEQQIINNTEFINSVAGMQLNERYSVFPPLRQWIEEITKVIRSGTDIFYLKLSREIETQLGLHKESRLLLNSFLDCCLDQNNIIKQ